MAKLSGSRSRLHLAIVVGAFLSSRLILWTGGVRFTVPYLGQDQLLDLDVLRADPFQAFTHNHIQPPLWNFFVGAVLRWSPIQPNTTFHVLFLVADLAMVIALWHLLSGLGARSWVATVASILVAWNPIVIGNENVLHYETLVTAVLVLSALTCLRYVRNPSPARLAGFSCCLVVGVLTRATLNPAWLVGGLAIVLLAKLPRERRPAYLGVASIALVVVTSLLVHRAVTYESVGFSSYWPMNLERITALTFPPEETRKLIAEGRVSPAAAQGPFAQYKFYAKYFPPCHPHTGSKALDEFTKRDGQTNLNNVCYLKVDKQARSDAIHIIRANPKRYLYEISRSAILYVSVGTDSSQPGTRLAPWASAYDPLLVPIHVHYSFGSGLSSLQRDAYERYFSSDPISITLVSSVLLCLVYAARGFRRWLGHRADYVDITRIFIGFTLVMITIPSVMFDTLENARYRASLDPILLGPVCVFILEAAVVGFARLNRWFTARRTGAS